MNIAEKTSGSVAETTKTWLRVGSLSWVLEETGALRAEGENRGAYSQEEEEDAWVPELPRHSCFLGTSSLLGMNVLRSMKFFGPQQIRVIGHPARE